MIVTENISKLNPPAAGPENLVNYFQKGALLGKKAALNLWYVDNRPNSKKFSRAFEGLSYLAYFFTNLNVQLYFLFT